LRKKTKNFKKMNYYFKFAFTIEFSFAFGWHQNFFFFKVLFLYFYGFLKLFKEPITKSICLK